MESGDPSPILETFSRHDVPFVVIGGHAVNYYGFVRATEDTDVVVLRGDDGDDALWTALTEINARWIGEEVDPATGLETTHAVTAEFVRATRLMMLVTDFGFLDVFDYVPGFPELSVQELFDSAEQSGAYRYVSLAWLRRLKRASGRPKDQLDLANLPEAGGGVAQE